MKRNDFIKLLKKNGWTLNKYIYNFFKEEQI